MVIRVRLVLLSLILGASTLAVSAPSSSASMWSLGSLPSVSNSGSAVSCVSSSACIGVGGTSPGFGWAYGWNGMSWASPAALTGPAGATRASLAGVSCSASHECTAVGSFINSAGETQTLAERGPSEILGTWSVQTTVSPTSDSSFAAVSCPSSKACTAVGSKESSTALAEGWNGTEWLAQTVPTPSEGEHPHLYGVSCSAASECTAVGDYFTTKGFTLNHALVDRWNGKEWVVQTVPSPEGALDTALFGVSCVSATACTAVGDYYDGTHNHAMVARWNGTSWSLQKAAVPSEELNSEFLAVSCATTEACTAVGGYDNKSEHVTLAEHWNSKEWLVQTTPNPSNNSALEGVSCTSTTACMAFGLDTSNKTILAERYS